jgi:exosortase
MSQVAQLEPTGKNISSATRFSSPWPSISWQLLIPVLLIGWLYSSILFHLASQWAEDPNFSHGFFVPLFAAFVLWRDRTRLANLPRRPTSCGILIVALSLAVLIVGILGAELFLARVSLLLLIAGLVLAFLGTSHFRAVLFPLSFLLLMIPIPALIFNQVTFPLQLLASKFAAGVLPWLGVPVLREGNIINLPAMSLEVAEACSGIRSLLSLITLAVIYGYLRTGVTWLRVALGLAAVPIAIFSNSLRIVVTGLIVQYWNPHKAEGFFHLFSGWLVFLVSIAILCLVEKTLSRSDLMRKRNRGVKP